jgi:hypothetical protein
VDLPADMLGELLKDRVLSTRRVPWGQTKYQNGEEYPHRYQADLRQLAEQGMMSGTDRSAGGWAKRHRESISCKPYHLSSILIAW